MAGATGADGCASMTFIDGASPLAAGRAARKAHRERRDLEVMSVQRGTRGIGTAAQRGRLAASLILLALPLSGCGTGALWDKFLAKDESAFADEPADKLYNEGLY